MKFTYDHVKAGLLLAGVAYTLYELHKASKAAGQALDVVTHTAATTLNPASNQNIIYQSIQQGGHALGKDAYIWLH